MNALKHAGPCEIRVSTISGDADLTLRVADNGKGFDASQAATHPHRCGGFGLFGIRQRLEGLGGRLEIASAPDKGTTATISVPTTARASEGER